jgi:NAD(P)-dependent dehydrogenase (short-subunit alcohol dehydrogenase family)
MAIEALTALITGGTSGIGRARSGDKGNRTWFRPRRHSDQPCGDFSLRPDGKTPEEEFDRIYSLNVKLPNLLVAQFAPQMAKRGKGAIVNVSTMVADYGVSGMALYGTSKAAIDLLTKAWAAEYGASGVRVNAVSPGPARTEGTEAMGEGLEQLAAEAPAGHPATADEMAEAIEFLATDRSSFIRGAILAVDGGRTAI